MAISHVYAVQFESRTVTAEGALSYAVSPDYFDTMRIPLRRGRLLNERDRADTPGVVLISESLAKSKFPDQDPIGQRVRVGPYALHAELPWATIVGVVGDVKQASLAVSRSDAFYTPTTTVALDRPHAVAGGAHAWGCRHPGRRHQERDLVGGQRPTDRAGGDHGNAAGVLGVPSGGLR